MKTLANHQLIYDKDCPMCKVYSQAFIKTKMLDENGRKNYRELSADIKCLLDLDKARNEIALVDHTEKKVYYGLDSLLIIIGNSFPFLEKIGRIGFIYWFFQKLYKMVSYNRKQIIPSKYDILENACVPDFNLKYRILYLIFGLLFSTYLLNQIFINSDYHQDYLLAFILIFGIYLWQTGFIFQSKIENVFNYLGNLNTIIISGSALIYMVSIFEMPATLSTVMILILIFLMVLDHFRRGQILKMNLYSSIAFLSYFVGIYLIFNL